MRGEPLDPHAARPEQLRDRLAAERSGVPFIVYRAGEDEQLLVRLEDGRTRLSIGRRLTNDVALDHDPEVSRVHAALERLGDEWTLVDDGLSHNGTWVNGVRVAGRHRLRDGDSIRIGRTVIAFCAADEASRPGSTVTARGPHVAQVVTPAQRRVLTALCRPLKDGPYATASNRQIAEELVIGLDTVKSTLRALFELVGLDDLPQNQKRASLAEWALRSGVITRREL